MELLAGPPGRIDVFDHHPMDSRDIPDATVHESPLGANTTYLGTLVMARGIARLFGADPDEAFTLALLHDVGKLVLFDRVAAAKTRRRALR